MSSDPHEAKLKSLTYVSVFILIASSVSAQVASRPAGIAPEAGEVHLANIRQLTNGGENAEAYFSDDGRRLIFQSTRDGRTCDQQYVMNSDGSRVCRVSNGAGKTS